jgi:hypothetical protein
MKTGNFTEANRGNREGRGAKDTWSKIATNFTLLRQPPSSKALWWSGKRFGGQADKVTRIWSDMLGFSRMGREAVETAAESAFWWSTSLKRGVNERGLGDFTGNFLSLKCFELL